MQYRLIKVDNEWRIRGITTTRYHNYDNYLAIYVTLLSLHRYAKEHHINYRIEKAYISDSIRKNRQVIIGDFLTSIITHINKPLCLFKIFIIINADF
jgi:hypothetical protein